MSDLAIRHSGSTAGSVRLPWQWLNHTRFPVGSRRSRCPTGNLHSATPYKSMAPFRSSRRGNRIGPVAPVQPRSLPLGLGSRVNNLGLRAAWRARWERKPSPTPRERRCSGLPDRYSRPRDRVTPALLPPVTTLKHHRDTRNGRRADQSARCDETLWSCTPAPERRSRVLSQKAARALAGSPGNGPHSGIGVETSRRPTAQDPDHTRTNSAPHTSGSSVSAGQRGVQLVPPADEEPPRVLFTEEAGLLLGTGRNREEGGTQGHWTAGAPTRGVRRAGAPPRANEAWPEAATRFLHSLLHVLTKAVQTFRFTPQHRTV